MCYEFDQYWVQRAEEARREAKRREEERKQEPEQPVVPGDVKDPEPVPV